MSEACPGCGTWVCDRCGWARVRAARWAPLQDCYRCHSTKGYWEETHHRSKRVTEDHAEAWAQAEGLGYVKAY